MKPNKIYEFPLEVIFEDEYLAVIYKPAGIVVSANNFRNIKNALPFNLKNSTMKDSLEAPLPCHRIDKETQGLLLIGKSKSSLVALNKLFEERKIRKTYHAAIHGTLDKKGIIDIDIEDKNALTHFEPVQHYKSLSYDSLSLVRLHPHTGRKHQLRIHLNSLNHGILGDPAYFGTYKRLYKKGMFLCATGLEFIHPITKEELQFYVEVPRKFMRILQNEERRYIKYNT